MNSAIEIKNLNFAYGNNKVIDNVNLSIPKNVRCAIVGPNGAGKSTLLKAVLGLLDYDNGEIKIFGQDIRNIRKKIAYVPQKDSVNWDFPITVYDVVMMGRYVHIGSGKKVSIIDKEKVEKALEEMGILDLKSRQISQLSGGQKQRVFLARALAQEVDLYILDEPLTGVDVKTEEIISKKFEDLQKQGKTIIAVHHNIYTLEKFFDYIIIFNKDVKIEGEIKEVNTPKNLDLAFRG